MGTRWTGKVHASPRRVGLQRLSLIISKLTRTLHHTATSGQHSRRRSVGHASGGLFGSRWRAHPAAPSASQVWYVHELLKYEFDLEFDLPVCCGVSIPRPPGFAAHTASAERLGYVCSRAHEIRPHQIEARPRRSATPRRRRSSRCLRLMARPRKCERSASPSQGDTALQRVTWRYRPLRVASRVGALATARAAGSLTARLAQWLRRWLSGVLAAGTAAARSALTHTSGRCGRATCRTLGSRTRWRLGCGPSSRG